MRRRTRVIRMTESYQDLHPGDDVKRPPHVAEALVRAGVAIFPEDAPVSRDCVPLPVADTGVATSDKRKRKRRKRRKGGNRGDSR